MRALATDGRTYIVELSEWIKYDPKRPKAKYVALTEKHKDTRTCLWGADLKRFSRLPDTIQIKPCDLSEEDIPPKIVKTLKSFGCK